MHTPISVVKHLLNKCIDTVNATSVSIDVDTVCFILHGVNISDPH